MKNLAPLVASTPTEAARTLIERMPKGQEFTLASVLKGMSELKAPLTSRSDEIIRRLVIRMIAEGTVKPSGKFGRKHRYIRA